MADTQHRWKMLKPAVSSSCCHRFRALISNFLWRLERNAVTGLTMGRLCWSTLQHSQLYFAIRYWIMLIQTPTVFWTSLAILCSSHLGNRPTFSWCCLYCLEELRPNRWFICRKDVVLRMAQAYGLWTHGVWAVWQQSPVLEFRSTRVSIHISVWPLLKMSDAPRKRMVWPCSKETSFEKLAFSNFCLQGSFETDTVHTLSMAKENDTESWNYLINSYPKGTWAGQSLALLCLVLYMDPLRWGWQTHQLNAWNQESVWQQKSYTYAVD